MEACVLCMGSLGYLAGEGLRTGAVIAATVIREASAINIANRNLSALVDSYKKLHLVAQRSLALAERQQNRLQQVFWPEEIAMLNEFGGIDTSIEDPEVLGKRYAGRLMASVTAGFARQLHALKCNSSRYGTSVYRKMHQDLLLARATAQTNAKILGRNIGYAEHQARTETNWNRRMQVTARGRGLLSQAASLTASAASGLAASASAKAAQFNSSLQDVGYHFQSAMDAFQENREVEKQDRAPGVLPQKSYGVLASDGEPATYGVLASDGNATEAGAAPWMFDGQKFMSQFSNPQAGQKAFDQAGNFVSDIGAYSGTNQDLFPNKQAEAQNHAQVGNKDKVRTGVVTFPVIGAGLGEVTIDMNAFGVTFVDNFSANPATGGGKGIPVMPFSIPTVFGI